MKFFSPPKLGARASTISAITYTIASPIK